MLIYLTRFLLTPLASPTNLITGGSGYAFWRFLTYDVGGELTWMLLYGGLGYAFGSSGDFINQGLLAGGLALGIGVYFWVRRRRQNQLGESNLSAIPVAYCR